MNAKNTVRINGLTVFLITFCMVFTAHVNVLNAGWLFGKLTEARKQAIREEVQNAIQEARRLSNEGKYDEALRLLFDAMYKEERTQLLIALDSDEEFPITAAHEITKLENSLIYEDQSPLMRLFRDPDFPLEEKLQYISALRELAARPWWYGKKGPFRGKYEGTLVQLMTSRTLNRGEKFDVLSELQYAVQTAYTSAAQRNQIKEEIAQLQTFADQKLKEHQYVEVFLLLSEVEQKLLDSRLYAQDHTTYRQIEQSIELYIQADESPLMQLFKNPEISVVEKQHLLAELQAFAKRSRTATDKVFLRGKEYDGMLVQIMSNPKISWLKLDILGAIERIIDTQNTAEIANLQALVDQHLREKRYVEAFILLSEAEKKSGGGDSILFYSNNLPLWELLIQSIQLFLQSDESPLMTLLKNPEISVTEREKVLAGIYSLITTDEMGAQVEYEGPLVQIFSNPKISEAIKMYIWVIIEKEQIEK